MPTTQTTILISNLHCSSCVNTIRETLSALSPPPTSIHTSIVSQSVTVEHPIELAPDAIREALDEAGFDLATSPNQSTYHLRRSSTLLPEWLTRKREKHAEQCLLCQQEKGAHLPQNTADTLVAHHSQTSSIADTLTHHTSPSPLMTVKHVDADEGPFKVTFSVDGMTCASCVGNVTRAAEDIAGVSEVAVNLLGKSATATVARRDLVSTVKAAIEDSGYDCEVISTEPLHVTKTQKTPTQPKMRTEDGPFRATFSVDGMTCASCVGNIIRAMEEIVGVSEVAVNLVGKSATAIIERKELVGPIVEAVSDCGYGIELVGVEPSVSPDDATEDAGPRTVSLRVEGMYCQHCPDKLMNALKHFGSKVTIVEPIKSFTDPNPVMTLRYTPSPPHFTLRHVVSALEAAKSPPFRVAVWHPKTLEERARAMHVREQRDLLWKLLFSVVVAIPTFILGIVFMALLPEHHRLRMFIMEPMWTGNTSRVQWALFIMATPVMFYSAMHFHRRCIKEIWGLWRPGSKAPIWRRFVRFGSMNMLVSLGVSIAYFSSIALLILAANEPRSEMGMGDNATYFDTTVLLTMFLLAGRYLEAYSKTRTADAITALGKLRPSEALLVVPASLEDQIGSFATPDTDLEKGVHPTSTIEDSSGEFSEKPGTRVVKVHVEMLEVDDIVLVPHGGTPPSDGVIDSREGSAFDESSLTGESKPIKKERGDRVFVGTINLGKAVEVKITTLGGETMLDQIVRVVREGATKRAPIERIADMLTGYFVPLITLLAILTWVIWLSLGLSGALPDSFLDQPQGGWTFWALEFAIAVFVVACPCGIGLAAPTALLVGSGLAAKFGILVRGGGEAFQEAAQLDVVVFDKTGTLTEGGEPKVTDADVQEDKLPAGWTRDQLFSVITALESASSHPLGTAIRNFCEEQDVKLTAATAESVEETAGKGLKGSFSAPQCTAIIGNEKWLEEHGTALSVSQESLLQEWKSAGKSVIVFAARDERDKAMEADGDFVLLAVFAAADTLRPESHGVVKALQKQGLGTWMISGDNPTTAKAVAKSVGIPETNVIAGVLPHQKAERIAWLQQVGMKREPPRWKRFLGIKRLNERCVVAMVGDGINDAPALTTADVGIAVGSGSDVAISSASFILIKSDLRSILTLTDLSRKVFNRVKFNFLWALMYNMIALPVAAGVIYPAGHVRLDPVWASLAMALSSVSVVLSSLHLKLYREPKV